jgi:hypothetical protein
MRRRRKQEQFLQRAKLLFAEAGLFKNLPKGSRWQRAGMHCDISLPSIEMAKNLVAPALSHFYESGANQSCKDLTGGVGHREFRPERSKISFRQERFHRASASLRPMPQSILERQRWLLRYPGREWSGRESECGRNNNPEIQVRLSAQEGRSNA